MSYAVTFDVVSTKSVWNVILTHVHFKSFTTRATGSKGNQTVKITPVDKTQHKYQSTQQQHLFLNRKNTSATAIIITVDVLPFQAVVVAVDMRSGPVGGPRARAAEQQQSSDVWCCCHDEGRGCTDRDPVPGSWTPSAPVRGQMNRRGKRISLFQIWASLCSKLMDFFELLSWKCDKFGESLLPFLFYE